MWKIYLPFVFLISAIQMESSLYWVPWHEGLLGVLNIPFLLIQRQHHSPASGKGHWSLLSFSLILEETVRNKYSSVCSKHHIVVIQPTAFHFTDWVNVVHIAQKQPYRVSLVQYVNSLILQDDSDSNNREDILPASPVGQAGPSGLMSGQGIAALDKATTGNVQIYISFYIVKG